MRGISRSHDRHSSIKHPCSSILENLCCSSTQKSSSLLLSAAQKFLRRTQNPQKFKKAFLLKKPEVIEDIKGKMATESFSKAQLYHTMQIIPLWKLKNNNPSSLPISLWRWKKRKTNGAPPPMRAEKTKTN